MYLMQTVSTGPSCRSFPHVATDKLDEITIMNSTEELSKYSDNNSHYRSPTLARRAATELDSPQPEKPPKSKKWTLGGLFRRRKKEETESSTEEDLSPKKGFLQRRKQRKEDKRKKKLNKAAGHFDHIVIPHQFANGKEEESVAIFSDPSNGFSSTKRTSSADRLTSRESLSKSRQESLSRASLGSGSLDSTGKKSRREKVKARVQAKRERLKDESSSDEGSQRSTTSSITRFKSDDSLSKKEASRKSRAARTERYNRRLTKEEETVLNKEAELKTTVEPKIVNRWVVVDEITKSPPMRSKPLLGYSPSNPLPQKPYPNISTIPPVIRTSSNVSDSQRNYFNSSHKPANVYAPRNQNLQRSFQNKREFNQEQRSYSYDCNINRSPTPVNEEDIIHVHFPIGKPIPKQRNPNLINNNLRHYSNQSLQRITPPPPPPRDPQRRMYPSVQYENTRPMSYAFENGQQRHSQQVDRTSSIRSYNFQNQPNQNQLWQNNYRSNSEDHIAQAQSFNQVPLINRPASATPDTPQQRYIRRHPNMDQYKYFAEKTPRSRKPIHIAPGPDQTYLSDSQVITRNSYRHPVHAASDFWKQKDLEEVRRKSQVIEPKIEAKTIPVKKIEVKDIKKNFSVLSVPVKTADSLSSLSGQSETSPLPPFFDPNDIRPLSMVLEAQENHDLPKVKNPPIPPIRYSRQSPASSSENTWLNETEEAEKKKRRSTNLEDALDELEAIYKSLRLGDEDLLDRAERRDVPSVVTQKLMDINSRDAQSDSGFNYDLDCVDGLRQKRLRRSNIPDKVNDDMAYRRLNRDRPPPLDINAAMSNVSYILASPVLSGSVDENDNEANINNNEPDIMLDDVVYRNLKHMNNTLKIADPQPPFGIPVGPITGAANSDYLHAVPETRIRPRFIPQKSPDIVKDDLAFRSLRKEGPITDDVLNNNNKPEFGLKKKRAVRSISANIYSMMHRDTHKDVSESENEFEKAQSLTDIADAMEIARQILKDRQNIIYRKSAVSDTEGRPITSNLNKSNIPTSTETLTDTKPDLQQKLQVYIPLIANEGTLNQKPPLCPTPDRKTSKPATKESTPNRVSPALDDNSLDNSHLEDLLTKLAIEARETSEKLGNDLKLLDEEQSRKCSPRLSGTNSPALDDSKTIARRKSIDEKLSDIDAVSEHAKLCERLLGCVVESTNLISHPIPEVKLQAVDEITDEMNEPKIFKSVANVIVTRKPDSPEQNSRPEVHSESDHDYENILKDLEDDKCISPFEEHREQLLADFAVLKNNLFSDEFLKTSNDLCAQTAPNEDDGTFGKLQDETCSEGEVCSSTDVDCLASNLSPTIAECDFSNASAPIAFNTTSDNSLYQHYSNHVTRADSEHSSGFQSHGSSSADSSLNPAFDFDDSLANSVLTVSNSDINYSVEVEINTSDFEGQIFNAPCEFADTTLLANSLEINLHDVKILPSIDHNNVSSQDESYAEDLNVSLPFVSLDDIFNYPSHQIYSPIYIDSSEDCTSLPFESLDDTSYSQINSITADHSLPLDSLDSTPQNICEINSSSVNFDSLTSIPFDSLDSPSKTPCSQIVSSSSESEPSDFESLPFEPLKADPTSADSSADQPMPSTSSIARRSNRSEDTLDSATIWYKDPATIALACSYSLAFAHQVAVLDLFTVLGLILAIVTVIAALIL